jgi:hypothetical protein
MSANKHLTQRESFFLSQANLPLYITKGAFKDEKDVSINTMTSKLHGTKIYRRQYLHKNITL